jgi:hypothetical protein
VGLELQKDLNEVLAGLDRIILGIKAKGGYKERQNFHLSDHELDLFLAECEQRLRIMVVSLVVAEAMLREPPPSIHPRWEEYQGRREIVVAELQK